ncbi:ammonium transporter AmtB-like domain-containing protein [Cladochytrium replicatum]|nr:ammonium transporter AmtB-like domain-containing protein [Cladochytrium replicatum]
MEVNPVNSVSTHLNLTLTNPAGNLADVGYASTGFMIICAALVFFMIPGLALLYSGLSRSKNALSMMLICVAAASIVMVQWVIWGFSLAFSETGSVFIGDCAWCGMTAIGSQAAVTLTTWVPVVAFALYQLMFAAITPAIIFGSPAERMNMIPAMLFVFIWSTVVYDIVAYWTWSAKGWVRNMACVASAHANAPCFKGSLDFAGGGPVHVASGFAGLAYSLVLGRRAAHDATTEGEHNPYRPHNPANVTLGTCILWFGWFGFNAGSASAATARAAMAGLVTTVAAASGGITWLMFDYIFTRKLSSVSLSSGIVAALVGITPGAGYVAPWASIVIGSVTALVCNLACSVKHKLGFDDALDAFGLHGVGGVVGNLLTGIFAQKWVASLDGTGIDGGWLDGNFIQLGYQLAGTAAIAVWSFGISYVILSVLNLIPGLRLRVPEESELLGLDVSHMGEQMFEFATLADLRADRESLEKSGAIPAEGKKKQKQPAYPPPEESGSSST